MQLFTQQVVTIGRITPQHVEMLGTGFFISSNKIATTRHVVGNMNEGIVVLAPHINDINAYQDTSDNRCIPVPARIVDIDPLKDLAILEIDGHLDGRCPEIGGFDDVRVSEEVGIFGFPHSVEGRRVLTFQKAEVGAKVLLMSNGIKSKHAVINIQSRPGQSGSLVFSTRVNKIVGILIGAYAPEGAGMSLGGINPRELHQTTHCISSEYLREML
ncbi:S1 family peptidase [Aeromonas dhakensis]|uniref:S1 family peptidase n=1 Tax=Aeromonas dhakensis TaxID=196024 RepID=UPI00288E6493|nr:serine protease [Aeromonas dhakensis]HDX9008790.1 trypsin-like peptidase domain-containing protein [Aeromonas dhakensis]